MAEIIVGGFDIETTGLLDPEHRIVEACVRNYKLDTSALAFELISSDVWRINPQRKIDKKAHAVHGISIEMLEACPDWKEVAPHIVARLNECAVVVAHNGFGFDFKFLIQECDRIEQEIPDFEPFDTMIDGRWATPLGKVPNLAELCFACDVEFNPALAHGAEYDVDVMMQSFFNGLRHGGFTLPDLNN